MSQSSQDISRSAHKELQKKFNHQQAVLAETRALLSNKPDNVANSSTGNQGYSKKLHPISIIALQYKHITVNAD